MSFFECQGDDTGPCKLGKDGKPYSTLLAAGAQTHSKETGHAVFERLMPPNLIPKPKVPDYARDWANGMGRGD